MRRGYRLLETHFVEVFGPLTVGLGLWRVVRTINQSAATNGMYSRRETAQTMNNSGYGSEIATLAGRLTLYNSGHMQSKLG